MESLWKCIEAQRESVSDWSRLYSLKLTMVACRSQEKQIIHTFSEESNQQLIHLGEIRYLVCGLFMPYPEVSASDVSSENMTILRYHFGEDFIIDMSVWVGASLRSLASMCPGSLKCLGGRFHSKPPPLGVASIQTPPLRKPANDDPSTEMLKATPTGYWNSNPGNKHSIFLSYLLSEGLKGHPGVLVSIKPEVFLIRFDLV